MEMWQQWLGDINLFKDFALVVQYNIVSKQIVLHNEVSHQYIYDIVVDAWSGL